MKVFKKKASPEESEQRFLKDYDARQFDRPSVAVDVVVLTAIQGRLAALVSQRADHPHKGAWSLPGGFIGMDESLEEAARRVLRDKSGITHVFVEQLFTFGDPNRDPRTRIIAVAYYALVDAERLQQTATKNARIATLEVPWSGETGGPVDVLIDDRPVELGFDHADIIGMAVKRIRGKLDYTPIGFQLLPDEFTLRRLQDVHETVLGHTLNKDSFRRRMLASGQLEATGNHERGVGHRPAELYRFVRRSAI